MMTFSSRVAATALVSLMLAGSAFAQTPAAPAPAAQTTAPAAKKAEKPRTEASLECSKQADAKGLHGKERKTFRAECKKTGGKAN
jgi:invasion protein IalB